MGGRFGELCKIRGIIYFKLSPHELKAFTGYISHSLPNAVRRISENVFTTVPVFVLAYGIYENANSIFHHSNRKNPKDFENDV